MIIFALVVSAHATNFTGTGTNWITSSNWNPSAVPTFGSTTVLTFGSPPNLLPPTYSYQPSGSYTATANGATVYDVNQMVFNGFGADDTSANGVVITTDNTAGSIRFLGTNPRITQNGSGSVQFANGTATTDVTLSAGDGLTIDGSGLGHVTLAGNLGGSGDLTIDQTGMSPLFTGAQVFLTPATSNASWTGNVNLRNGNLALNGNTPLGPAVTNQLVINGGTLRMTASGLTIANTLTVNAQLVFTGINGGTFIGAVSGNGGVWVNASNSPRTSRTQSPGRERSGSKVSPISVPRSV